MVFHDFFFRCFHFTTDFYYCWLDLLISPNLGFSSLFLQVFLFHLWFLLLFFGCSHFTNFFYHDCFFVRYLFLCCCTGGATDLRELFFYSQMFFTLHTFPIFATVPRVLRIWESFIYSQTFFTLHSFPAFGKNLLLPLID